MDRKLRFLRNELEKAGVEVRPSASVEAPDPQSMKLNEWLLLVALLLVLLLYICPL